MTPLTKAELSRCDDEHNIVPRMEDGCCLIHLALTELRDLRADIADVRSKNRELVTENAALVAALERIGWENCRCGCRRLANLALVAHQDATLASVRGDA